MEAGVLRPFIVFLMRLLLLRLVLLRLMQLMKVMLCSLLLLLDADSGGGASVNRLLAFLQRSHI